MKIRADSYDEPGNVLDRKLVTSIEISYEVSDIRILDKYSDPEEVSYIESCIDHADPRSEYIVLYDRDHQESTFRMSYCALYIVAGKHLIPLTSYYD